MDTLLKIDIALFYFINISLQNFVFDWFMPFITNKYHWFPVWILLAVFLVWKGGKKGRIVLLLIIPVIFLSDQISSHILKSYFERLRPCIVLSDIHLIGNRKSSSSFPSSHAANFFAAAAFFNYFYPKYRWLYFIIAFLVSSSRIYIGIHFPSDVIAGGILGVLCAYFIIFLWHLTQKLYKKNKMPAGMDSKDSP
jgi:undecaprenyl-diphosphatase